MGLLKIKEKYYKPNHTVLEIGPFFKPRFEGNNVKYFDILSQQQLKKRVVEVGHEEKVANNVPYINYVRSDGRLVDIKEKFDIVFSSHCIEHQLCMIRHFNDVSAIVKKGGYYFLTIPDKRYCFDHFIPHTSIADIIEVFNREQQNRHSLRSVIAAKTMTTHNSSEQHWSGNHGLPKHYEDPNLILKTIKEYNLGHYIDVHAWQFTPDSFCEIYNILKENSFVDMDLIEVYETRKNHNDFNIVLQKR